MSASGFLGERCPLKLWKFRDDQEKSGARDLRFAGASLGSKVDQQDSSARRRPLITERPAVSAENPVTQSDGSPKEFPAAFIDDVELANYPTMHYTSNMT